MRTGFRRYGRIALLGMAALGLAGFAGPRPECIAPSPPGGGWDFTCRTVGRLMQELGITERSVQITNLPGGVGAVAFSSVAANHAADPSILVATSTVGITQIAQKRYPGDIDRMRWVAMLGTDVGVILVRPDAPYKTLKDLFAALKQDPTAAVTGGSSGAGGYDHLRLLLLARSAGLATPEMKRIRWIQYEGGSNAVTQLLGSHVDVVATDLAEIAGFVEAKQVRVLGILSEERLGAPYAEIPTAREQGLDVVGLNWRGFYTGGRVSDEAYEQQIAMLKRLYDSEQWKQAARNFGLTPVWRGGKEFQDFVRTSTDALRTLSQDIGVIR